MKVSKKRKLAFEIFKKLLDFQKENLDTIDPDKKPYENLKDFLLKEIEEVKKMLKNERNIREKI